MPLIVEIKDEQLKGLGAQLADALKNTLLEMSNVAYDKMQQGAARHRGSTGALFRSLYNRAIPDGREVGHDPTGLTVPWRGGTNRAVFVLYGTRPHDIFPRKRKALRWVQGSDFVFAQKVRHPGYIGDNYMIPAADEALRQFNAIISRRLAE